MTMNRDWKPGDYLLIAEQNGGCDYTIGCGLTILNLGQCGYMGEAIKLAEQEVAGFTHEHELSKAAIVKVTERHELDVAAIYRAIREQEQLAKASEKERQERELLARLQQKYPQS